MPQRGVYQYDAPGGAVRLVGITKTGDVAFELTVARPFYSPFMEERCERWLDTLDPPLRLLASDAE